MCVGVCDGSDAISQEARNDLKTEISLQLWRLGKLTDRPPPGVTNADDTHLNFTTRYFAQTTRLRLHLCLYLPSRGSINQAEFFRVA